MCARRYFVKKSAMVNSGRGDGPSLVRAEMGTFSPLVVPYVDSPYIFGTLGSAVVASAADVHLATERPQTVLKSFHKITRPNPEWCLSTSSLIETLLLSTLSRSTWTNGCGTLGRSVVAAKPKRGTLMKRGHELFNLVARNWDRPFS